MFGWALRLPWFLTVQLTTNSYVPLARTLIGVVGAVTAVTMRSGAPNFRVTLPV
jgi:hypothetical protein